MRKLKLLVAFVSVSVGCAFSPAMLASIEQASAAPTAHPAASTKALGEKLVRKFLDLLKDGDAAGLRAFLSPAFQIQRADGSFLNKDEYLKAPAKVESYEIQQLRVTRDGSVIVARYDLIVESTINGVKQSAAPAPRLSVFAKGKHGWQIIAHANFNTPAAPQQ